MMNEKFFMNWKIPYKCCLCGWLLETTIGNTTEGLTQGLVLAECVDPVLMWKTNCLQWNQGYVKGL